MKGVVLDSGALIALERRKPIMLQIIEEVLAGALQVVVPRTVVAQVWRGGPKQAGLARLIRAGRADHGPVIIDELTAARAEQIGITIGRVKHPDIVDVHVALAAGERHCAVLTSDDADIARVDADLEIVHV